MKVLLNSNQLTNLMPSPFYVSECRVACNKLGLGSAHGCRSWLRASHTLPSNRQYLSCDACLEVKREDNQNFSVLCCVRQLCTMIRTQMWAVLTVLWIGFYHAGFISLCIDLFVFICVKSFFVFYCIYVIVL